MRIAKKLFESNNMKEIFAILRAASAKQMHKHFHRYTDKFRPKKAPTSIGSLTRLNGGKLCKMRLP
jgi:hypothetical protein